MVLRECRGTHKHTKGLGCKKIVDNRVYGLCKKCKIKWALNNEHGKVWLAQEVQKKKKKDKVAAQKKKRELSSLSKNWSNRLQTTINNLVRHIDYGLPCIVRNTRGKIDAGHVYARGEYRNLRFNLHNIHRQSSYSNHFKNDDGALKEAVALEYGNDYFIFLKSITNCKTKDYTNKELRDITYKARSIYNTLSKEKRIYTTKERIEMRNRVNLELKIYLKKDSVFNF